MPSPTPPPEPNASCRETSADIYLILYALLVGVIAGFGAVVFRKLIALFHNLLFFGNFSFSYDALVHAAESPWGIGVIGVPVVGALIVAFLVKTFAPEAKGHGVPEVIDAIYYNRGIIRPQVAVIKSLASSVSIGSGGSIGREGPIIQIGATFGSVFAQWLRLPDWQRMVLIACGAGGGIAATFNTPIGGILFAVEIMMVEISSRTLIPVMIATGIASLIGRAFFGDHSSFIIPALTLSEAQTTPFAAFATYAGLGLVLGLLAAVYTRSIYAFEDFFDRLPGNYYTRHVLGMAAVGVMLYLLMQTVGHYYVEGVGYATIQDILDGHLTVTWLLLLLVVLKLLAVSLTLGSGASGGIFSPGLFMGAALGAGLISLAQSVIPSVPLSPVSGAVIGMACVIAASTGAAVTAVVMIFEMTRDYNVIIPLIVAVSLAYALHRFLLADSIYTLKLSRRGHHIPSALQSHLYLMRPAVDLVHAPFIRLECGDRLRDLKAALDGISNGRPPYVLLTSAGRIRGVIPADVVATLLAEDAGDTALERFAEAHHVVVSEDTEVFDLVARLRQQQCRIALVTKGKKDDDPEGVVAVISWTDIVTQANLPENLGTTGAGPKQVP